MKDIRFVCVDPSPSRPPLPAWLKVVPTLILGNGDDPLIGPMAVNNWLFNKKLMQSGPASGSTSGPTKSEGSLKIPEYSPEIASRPNPSKGSEPVASGAEPLAWHGAEMGGDWSDNYSFLGGEFTSEKGMNPILRNFETLQSAPAPGMQTQAQAPAKQRSPKEEKLMKDFESFSKMRDMEFAPTKRMG